MNTICKLLNAHRSIRKFTDQKVSEEQIQTILQAGNRAASSSNLQARSIIRVMDKKKRSILSRVAGNQEYIISAAEFWVFCADFKHAESACSLQNKEMIKGMTEQFVIATVDVALMAQNCVIAAESMGLGICYIGALRNDPKKVCELLQLPEQLYPVFGLCIGYPAQNPEIKPRLPLDIVLKTDAWVPDDPKKIREYDDTLNQYYLERTGGNKNTDWSTEVSNLISKESRPHMKRFLDQQGFEMK